jgi:hypothetical protein
MEEKKKLIPPVLDCYNLELQHPLFKLSMASNSQAMLEAPFDINPVSCLWRMLHANIALVGQFPEYIRLAQIALVHVLGSVEDERCFSSLTFLKDKLQNRLASDHLSVVMGLYGQQVYNLENFPYDDCFHTWVLSVERYRYGVAA